MTAIFYCLDNDILLKLATLDLFDETLELLNTNYSQVRILGTFKYKFGKPKKRRRGNKSQNYNLEKALEIAGNLTEISNENMNPLLHKKILKLGVFTEDNGRKIDEGEATLIAYLNEINQQRESGYLLTGDKNCLRGLATPEFAEIVEPLKGKILCLEQLILGNIRLHGFDFVKNKVYDYLYCDTNLKCIFGYSQKLPETQVIHSLINEIRTLNQQTSNLLSPKFSC